MVVRGGSPESPNINVVTAVLVIGSWLTARLLSGSMNELDHLAMLIGKITAVYDRGYLSIPTHQHPLSHPFRTRTDSPNQLKRLFLIPIRARRRSRRRPEPTPPKVPTPPILFSLFPTEAEGRRQRVGEVEGDLPADGVHLDVPPHEEEERDVQRDVGECGEPHPEVLLERVVSRAGGLRVARSLRQTHLGENSIGIMLRADPAPCNA